MSAKTCGPTHYAGCECHEARWLAVIADMRAAIEAHACLPQLRHLYAQMVRGNVRDTKQAADGLLAPAIVRLERLARG